MSINIWMDKKVAEYIYTIENYSAIKKNTFESILVKWIKLELVIHSDVKSEREKQILYINTYIWNLEKWYDEPICRAGIETETKRREL